LLNTGKGYNRVEKFIAPPGHIPGDFQAYFLSLQEEKVI
jgi:hypothetical protein